MKNEYNHVLLPLDMESCKTLSSKCDFVVGEKDHRCGDDESDCSRTASVSVSAPCYDENNSVAIRYDDTESMLGVSWDEAKDLIYNNDNANRNDDDDDDPTIPVMDFMDCVSVVVTKDDGRFWVNTCAHVFSSSTIHHHHHHHDSSPTVQKIHKQETKTKMDADITNHNNNNNNNNNNDQSQFDFTTKSLSLLSSSSSSSNEQEENQHSQDDDDDDDDDDDNDDELALPKSPLHKKKKRTLFFQDDDQQDEVKKNHHNNNNDDDDPSDEESKQYYETKSRKENSTQDHNSHNHANRMDINDDIIDDDDSLTQYDCTTKSYQPTLASCLSMQPPPSQSIIRSHDDRRRKRPHLTRLKMSQQEIHKKQHNHNNTLRNPFQPTIRKQNQRMIQQNISNLFFHSKK